jgi:hypothetical protein
MHRTADPDMLASILLLTSVFQFLYFLLKHNFVAFALFLRVEASCSLSRDSRMRRPSVEASGSANAALERMGYQSELPRNLSMLSVLGLYVDIFFSLFKGDRFLNLTPTGFPQVFRHHGGALWAQHDTLHHADGRTIRDGALGLGARDADLDGHRGLARRDLRRLPDGGRRVLLERDAVDTRVRAGHVIHRRLVDAGGQLDGDAEHQLLGRAADPQRHLAVERGLCSQCVADHPDVLGRHARVCAGQRVWVPLSRPDQQGVHLLDRDERRGDSGHAACHGR